LGGEGGLVLGVEGQGQDVPRVEGLVVGGGDVEGGYLVFWVRCMRLEGLVGKYHELCKSLLTGEAPLLRLVDVSPPERVDLVCIQHAGSGRNELASALYLKAS
jgi:hypothetical protein